MSTTEEPLHPTAPVPRPYDAFAAVLSYLVPGLGQIYQGRVGKGLLFMVCLLGMFFYGMHLGDGKNVYLPDSGERNRGSDGFRWFSALINDRLAFAGQFWIGAAAWPAILQYNNKWPITDKANSWHDFQATPPEAELNQLQTNSDKHWDLGWVYTVIAGVLNILVIYDALAGPAFLGSSHQEPTTPRPEQEAATI